MDDETIVALATPPGKAGIAVIRISGSKSEAIVRALIEPLPAKLAARKNYHGFIHSGGQRIDECLTVLFRSPRSYSGEDMAEVSLHSNLFVVEEVLGLMCRLGSRLALPGEFTYRAFKNGKIDLIQAEAVNDLIQANSRASALMEFGNLQGRLSKTVAKIREHLLQAAIEMDARIEFAEDQLLEVTVDDAGLTAAASELEKILSQSRFSEIFHNGLQVVIAGKVNVGKSSLFNALLLKERSIISHLPGTTRDYIQEKLYVDGFPVQITDMAGISGNANDEVENQGIQRSLAKIDHADAVVFVVDASRQLEKDDEEIYTLIRSKKHILLANKNDLADQQVIDSIRVAFPAETVHLLSAKNQENIEAAVDFLKSLLRDLPEPDSQTAVNFRQKLVLEKLLQQIRLISEMRAQRWEQSEVIAEEIRRALELIGELTGAISSADILQGIFAKFCIGK